MRKTKGLVANLLFILLTSCVKVGPTFELPEIPSSPFWERCLFENRKTKDQIFVETEEVPREWWQCFQSDALNALVQQGLEHNPSIDAKRAALRASYENIQVHIGNNLIPNLTLGLNLARQREIGATFGAGDQAFIFHFVNPSLSVAYRFDLFGKARKELEALEAQVNYQCYQVEAAYLQLTAQIVDKAIAEASLRENIKETKKLIAFQKETLDLLNKQFELGAISKTNVLFQKTLLSQTKATLYPLEKQLAQTQNALQALIGELPEMDNGSFFRLKDLKLPRELPLLVPSQWARQRPDIKSAEALLHKATAEVGVATAALFPQIQLSASTGFMATRWKNLFSPSTHIWSMALQVMQPVFQGGALFAQRRASIALCEEAYANYQQTVLQAFQEVADVLKAIEMDAKTFYAILSAENTAKESLQLVENQYRMGAVPYLALLNAQIQYQETVLARIQAQAMRYSDTVALFAALGSTWWENEEEC